MSLTKIITVVAGILTGDEFRSDDDDGGVELYWIAETDATLNEDGVVRALVTRFPSRMKGDPIAWADPGLEITVWRPDAGDAGDAGAGVENHFYAASALRSGVFYFVTDADRAAWMEDNRGFVVDASRVDPELRASFEAPLKTTAEVEADVNRAFAEAWLDAALPDSDEIRVMGPRSKD